MKLSIVLVWQQYGGLCVYMGVCEKKRGIKEEEKSGKRGGGTQALLKGCVPWC